MNETEFVFNDILNAVDALFKSCAALHSWPFMCDYVFSYIQDFLFKIPLNRSLAFVSKTYGITANFETALLNRKNKK